MNNKFDELTKSLAESVTRRAALKKFGVGLAGMALACFGLAPKSQAGKADWGLGCQSNKDCQGSYICCFSSVNGTKAKFCVPNKSYCL